MTICENVDCTISAYFNVSGQTIGRFCNKHKTVGMINVKDKLCAHADCNQRPSFNILGGKPIYCGTHKLDGMANVMIKTCEHANCQLTPVYNSPETKTGRFCATHKSAGMINVVNKTCEYTDCLKSPSYGLAGQRPRFCVEHKQPNMVDTKHKTCLYENCELTPSYGNPTDKAPTYCSAHRLEGMINIKHKKCVVDGCRMQPTYNYIGEITPRYCKEHKLDLMVDVQHRKCNENECIRRPLYNYTNESRPIYCVNHKLPNMIDVQSKQCLTYLCSQRSYRPSFEGYCTFCFTNLFPEKPVVRNYKSKEKSVAEYILNEFPNMTWISDKRVQDGCSRRRPDLVLDLGYQIIIIEIDENQHTDYDCSCENKRLMEISQDVGHRNIIFIRFNPDQYIEKDGSKIKSCWTINKHGLSVVTKNNNKEWNNRLNALKKQIQYWIDNNTDKMVEIIQLYYDEC